MHDAITGLSSNQWREQNLMMCRMLAGVNGRLKGKYFERFAKEYHIPCHISEQTRKNTFAFYKDVILGRPSRYPKPTLDVEEQIANVSGPLIEHLGGPEYMNVWAPKIPLSIPNVEPTLICSTIKNHPTFNPFVERYSLAQMVFVGSLIIQSITDDDWRFLDELSAKMPRQRMIFCYLEANYQAIKSYCRHKNSLYSPAARRMNPSLVFEPEAIYEMARQVEEKIVNLPYWIVPVALSVDVIISMTQGLIVCYQKQCGFSYGIELKTSIVGFDQEQKLVLDVLDNKANNFDDIRYLNTAS